MMQVWSTIVSALETHGTCALVSQLAVEGSAPREAGARMVVMPDGTFTGTIGGGALEWNVLARTQRRLTANATAPEISRHALGPELGQCCGGAVKVMIEVWTEDRRPEALELASAERVGVFATRTMPGGNKVARQIIAAGEVDASDMAPVELIEHFGQRLTCVYLFGAGHVGRAVMLALAPLPFEVVWIDPRRDAFPAAVPGNLTMVASRDPAGQLNKAPDDAFIVVMTHSHALDLEIVQRALQSDRFAYVGVIGSKTKRARFVSRMRAAGLAAAHIAKLVCPIGLDIITSKHPAAIAAGLAAQLLVRDELVKSLQKPVQFSTGQATLGIGHHRSKRARGTRQ